MIVTDETAVMDRLYRLADKFNAAYERKDYALAMFTRYDALILMLNLYEKGNPADEELMLYLFGEGNGPDEDVRGLFDRDKVQKARFECVRQNRSVPYIDETSVLRALEIIK